MEPDGGEVLTPELEAVTGGTLGDLFRDDLAVLCTREEKCSGAWGSGPGGVCSAISLSSSRHTLKHTCQHLCISGATSLPGNGPAHKISPSCLIIPCSLR